VKLSLTLRQEETEGVPEDMLRQIYRPKYGKIT
jgi:hypothetical protein